MKTLAGHLRKAMRERELIEFGRRFDDGNETGYVLDVGPEFFLIATIDGAIRFDGFGCFRMADFTEGGPHPSPEFVEAALRWRKERFPRKPRVDLGDTAAILQSAGRAFPLVVIHREDVHQDVCEIGRVVGVRDGRVSLLEIDSAAKWDEKPTEYLLGEITRVSFGGGYEQALYAVGGEPGSEKRQGRAKGR